MPRLDRQFREGATRELQVSTSAQQGPDVDCKKLTIKARSGNTGKVAFGFSSAVTIPDGTTDANGGYELEAGEPSVTLLSVGNLNQIWYIGQNATDSLIVLIER